MSGGGAERDGDTESEAGSRLWAVSTEPNGGEEGSFPQEGTELWDHDLNWSRTLNQLSHTGAPASTTFHFLFSTGYCILVTKTQYWSFLSFNPISKSIWLQIPSSFTSPMEDRIWSRVRRSIKWSTFSYSFLSHTYYSGFGEGSGKSLFLSWSFDSWIDYASLYGS